MDVVLGYESRDSGALEPGEQLLWEGGGRGRQAPAFRITSRRAFCLHGKPDATKHRGVVQWPLRQPIVVLLRTRQRATMQLGKMLWLTDVDDWVKVAACLSWIHRRRSGRRRRGAARGAFTSMTEALPMAPTEQSPDPLAYSSPVTELGLLEDERVLWTGQPARSWNISWSLIRQKLTVLLAMLIPTAMVLRIAYAKQFDAVDVIFGLIAVFWFPLGIHSLTTRPLMARWRLARTRYTLSSRRAFAIEPAGGGRRIKFVFIDALPARFERVVHSNGTGDVTVGHGIAFQQIPDASMVHTQLVAAVLAARKDLPDLGWQNS